MTQDLIELRAGRSIAELDADDQSVTQLSAEIAEPAMTANQTFQQ